MKVCTQCGANKSLDEYRPDKRRRDGRRSNCRACGRAYGREYSQRREVKEYRWERWREYQREYQREYNQRPDVKAKRAARQLAAKHADANTWTKGRIMAQWEYQQGLCALCTAPLQPGYHKDHVVPAKRGGRMTECNLQLLCPFCNLSKAAKLL